MQSSFEGQLAYKVFFRLIPLGEKWSKVQLLRQVKRPSQPYLASYHVGPYE